jgi:pyruvate/2-oxoglutarate dehydrogenase complex dihydrolipoamide dehydrogenase (E3) component
VIPFFLFIDPELVRVGRNESEVRRDGVAYRIATMPMADVLRTRTVAEACGFLKMLSGALSDDIPGLTAFGFEASELMAAVHTAMVGRMPYTMWREAMFKPPRYPKG